MDRLSTLQLFARVLELGSFTRAAQELGLGQPSVSKQVAALEARLGTQLLERTSRRLRPTAAGQELYNSAVRLLAEIEEMENHVSGGSRGPEGLVRVATPPALGRMYMIPRLPEFFAQFPKVTVEFCVAQRRIDLIQEGVDIALRIGDLRSSSLVARRIGGMKMITVATPDYLAANGTPSDLHELARHNLITGQTDGGAVSWQFKDDDRPVSMTPSGTIRSNDGEDLRASVLAGLGILQGPTALFHTDLQEGKVVRLLEQFEPDAVPIHVISSSGRKMAYRVRVFVDFLASTFASAPGLRCDHRSHSGKE